MPTVLAIDTSQRRTSAAVISDGATLACLRREGGASEELVTAVNEVLTQAGVEFGGLSALSVVCGPGSFTGIRTAMAFAQGASSAFDNLRLLAVPVFAAAAFGLYRSGQLEERSVFALAANAKEYFLSEAALLSEAGSDTIVLADKVTCCERSLLPESAICLDEDIELSPGAGACAEAVLAGKIKILPGNLATFAPIYGKSVNAKTVAERAAQARS